MNFGQINPYHSVKYKIDDATTQDIKNVACRRERKFELEGFR